MYKILYYPMISETHLKNVPDQLIKLTDERKCDDNNF